MTQLNKINKFNIPEILTRLVLGIVFIESGWGKFQDMDKVISYFNSLHIPFAFIQAPLVSGLELIGGLFILIGLFTRISTIPLIVIMSVALLTAKADDLTDLSALFGLSEFLYIVLLSWLAFNGSKIFSIDILICKKCQTDACLKS